MLLKNVISTKIVCAGSNCSWSTLHFSSLPASSDFCRPLINLANSFDPDLA